MAKQIINIGEEANDGTGDPIRSAMSKSNANFTEVYDSIQDLTLLNLGITDGTAGQVLSADGDGTFTFVNQGGSSLPDTDHQIIGTQEFGRINSQDIYVPFVINDTVTGTLQDVIPPTNVVNGKISALVYTKQLARYTAGGKLMLTLLSNTGVSHYATKEFLFSRVEDADGGVFDVIETGIGSDDLMNGIQIKERITDGNLFLDVTITASPTGITATEFVRVVGQITYTSIPIFLTASGY
mgnify:FL=1|tara:strand:+ start:30669 stop:31388 length:720 start_codon:yes stop_codon:yes gene_type:complete